MQTLVIAEAGVNHNGSEEYARKLIDVAADSEADYIKFQTFSAERLVIKGAPRADYQIKNMGGDENQLAMLQRLELPIDAYKRLAEYCAMRGIGFMSTGFDNESVDFLAQSHQAKLKIPSCEVTNFLYLKNIAAYNREIFLSTGMASIGEVEWSINTLERFGTPREKITVLHCTSEYPAPFNEVNLRAMLTIKKAFNVRVGYSDHTLGIEVPIAAVTLGASVIEKHFTLDRSMPGPDHKASLEPKELRAMVAAIRNVERALGDGVKRITSSEARNSLTVRKSIVAARDIQKGDAFSSNNLTVKRPGNGLSPMLYESLLGVIATRSYKADELIER